jgi:hypothetical protein
MGRMPTIYVLGLGTFLYPNFLPLHFRVLLIASPSLETWIECQS